MTRPLFTFDYENMDVTDVAKERNEDPQEYDFSARPNEVKALRHPRCLITTPLQTMTWKVLKFRKLGGQPVQGRHRYRVCVELINAPGMQL